MGDGASELFANQAIIGQLARLCSIFQDYLCTGAHSVRAGAILKEEE
jgi:hypothetical protein